MTVKQTHVNFFERVQNRTNLHPGFLKVAHSTKYKFARKTLTKIQKTYNDPDGNLVEQFQTTGFDQRLFEIYLNEAFKECGFIVDRDHSRPDFILQLDDISIAVEATTASQSHLGTIEYDPVPNWGLNADGVRHKSLNDWAIRLGSPLYTKYRKEYWKLPHVEGKPFVIAIQDMSRSGSLKASSATLMQYLYGIKFGMTQEQNQTTSPTFERTTECCGSEKTIPSRFFDLPEAKYISAIIFSNTGDLDAFNRMGYVKGGCDEKYIMLRYGMCDDGRGDGNPAPFIYRIGCDRAPRERWSTGLVIAHNPNALNPIPLGLFGEAVENRENSSGQIESSYTASFRPLSSQTVMHSASENTNGDVYRTYAAHIVKESKYLGPPFIACFS